MPLSDSSFPCQKQLPTQYCYSTYLMCIALLFYFSNANVSTTSLGHSISNLWICFKYLPSFWEITTSCLFNVHNIQQLKLGFQSISVTTAYSAIPNKTHWHHRASLMMCNHLSIYNSQTNLVYYVTCTICHCWWPSACIGLWQLGVSGYLENILVAGTHS